MKHRRLWQVMIEVFVMVLAAMGGVFVCGTAFLGFPHVLGVAAERLSAGTLGPVSEFFVSVYPTLWFCGGIMLGGAIMFGGIKMAEWATK